jgi:hypothetical protein
VQEFSHGVAASHTSTGNPLPYADRLRPMLCGNGNQRNKGLPFTAQAEQGAQK